jgi:hypothetical protein
MEEKRLHKAPEIRKSPSCPDHQASDSGARLCAERRVPCWRKGYRSQGEKSTLRSMERKRILILGILLFLLCCIIFMALWLAGHLALGAGLGPSQGTSVESISDLGMFTIDPAFMQATPHWMLIVTGRKEQEAMIRYIENTSASAEKKAAWEATLWHLWTAYPTKAVPSADGTMLTCDCDLSALKLTGSEEASMREIETEIGMAMEKSLETPTTPAST